MKAVRTLLWLGVAFLVATLIRVVAFPIIEPADPEHPSLWAVVSNYSLLLWVPAAACFGFAAFLWLRGLAVRWIERG